MTVFDLGSLHLITDRPDAAPAPWPAVAGPGDPPIPAGPWAPNADMARLAELVADTDERIASARDVVADVERALAAIRRPLVFPTPITDPALKEVA